MIEEAVIAGDVVRRGVLRRGPEEAQRRERAVGGLRARDPAVFDADGIRGERESDGSDARERRSRPAVGSEAVAGRRQVPEKAEGAVLERVEKRGGVGRNARAPGVAATCSEGQGKNDGCETATATDQKLYSAPSCSRRGSAMVQLALPKFGSVGLNVLKHP